MTEAWSNADGEPIPPRTIAVRRQWYCGKLSSVERQRRRRNLPIPEPLFPILLGLSQRRNFTGPDDFVLVSRNGTPIHERNIVLRRLKRIGRGLQMPWLSWHVFQRTHTTLARELGNLCLANSASHADNGEGLAVPETDLVLLRATA